jgi:DNA-binding IclR family transcriptional regulator
MADHARELLTLIEGTPDAGLYLDELAREAGISQEEAGRILEQLEREGRIVWEGEPPIAVERD